MIMVMCSGTSLPLFAPVLNIWSANVGMCFTHTIAIYAQLVP